MQSPEQSNVPIIYGSEVLRVSTEALCGAVVVSGIISTDPGATISGLIGYTVAKALQLLSVDKQ